MACGRLAALTALLTFLTLTTLVTLVTLARLADLLAALTTLTTLATLARPRSAAFTDFDALVTFARFVLAGRAVRLAERLCGPFEAVPFAQPLPELALPVASASLVPERAVAAEPASVWP